MSLKRLIMETIPYEERAHSRYLTDTEADLLDRLEARRATRLAYSHAQGRGQ